MKDGHALAKRQQWRNTPPGEFGYSKSRAGGFTCDDAFASILMS